MRSTLGLPVHTEALGPFRPRLPLLAGGMAEARAVARTVHTGRMYRVDLTPASAIVAPVDGSPVVRARWSSAELAVGSAGGQLVTAWQAAGFRP
jgi:hypothetical protein